MQTFMDDVKINKQTIQMQAYSMGVKFVDKCNMFYVKMKQQNLFLFSTNRINCY